MKRITADRLNLSRLFGIDLLADPVTPAMPGLSMARPPAGAAPAAPPPPTQESHAAGVELSATVARLDVTIAKLQAVASTASPAIAGELLRAAAHLSHAHKILRSPTFRPRQHRRFAGIRRAA